MIIQLFQEINIKRIVKVDEYFVDVIPAKPDFRDQSDVVKNCLRYWQRERKKGGNS